MELNIVAVTINQRLCDPKYTKVLSENCYLFNDRVRINSEQRIELNPDFKGNSWYFGKNINVQAIVGPNGSGKSSLLELIYRIINNFSALVERGMKRNASWKLMFVTGVYADLYYVQDNHLYCISCRGNDVLFLTDDHKERVFSANTHSYHQSRENKLLVKEMAQLAEKLHYTIVTNYSLQSLVSSDYADEVSLSPDNDGVYAPENDGTVWISHLYHKNDGYLTPIVLNPFRDKTGNIDIVSEHRLTIYRLSALLLYYRNRRGFFDDYELNDITYRFNIQAVYEKFESSDKLLSPLRQTARNIEEFAREHQNSTFSILLKQMDCGDIALDHDVTRAATLYLVYKILTIASKYPSYNEFDKWSVSDFNKTNLTFSEIDSLSRLTSKIKRDKSHITIKVVQVLTLLDIVRKYGVEVLERESIGVDEYIRLQGGDRRKDRNTI